MTPPLLDSRPFFALMSLLSALFTLLLLATSAPPPASPAELLAQVRAHRGQLVVLPVLVLCWSVVSVPFVVAVARRIGERRRALALAATLLATGGILLLGFGTFMSVGALLAIDDAARAAPGAPEATFHAAVWRNLSFLLSDPGLMLLGAGQAIFGVLAWPARGARRTVAVLWIAGGIAGLLTLAVFQTAVLALIQLAAFCICGFVTAVALFRRDRPAT